MNEAKQTLFVERVAKTEWITFQRTEQLNAMSTQMLREIAATAAQNGLLPAALHLVGAVNVVPDRLSRGFVSEPSLAALGLTPSARRRPVWDENLWITEGMRRSAKG